MLCAALQGMPRTLHAYNNWPETPFHMQNQMLAENLYRKFGAERDAPLTSGGEARARWRR